MTPYPFKAKKPSRSWAGSIGTIAATAMIVELLTLPVRAESSVPSPAASSPSAGHGPVPSTTPEHTAALGLGANESGVHEGDGSDAFPPPTFVAPPRGAASSERPSLHPPVILRDIEGVPVMTSGRPLAAETTCGGCHDVAWILQHSSHSGIGRSSSSASSSSPPSGAFALSEGASAPELPTCLFCHVRDGDREGWRRERSVGDRAWADTALLASTGLVTKPAASPALPLGGAARSDGASAKVLDKRVVKGRSEAEVGIGWRWNQEAFSSDGSVDVGHLHIGPPSAEVCGSCHALVHFDSAPLTFDLRATKDDRGTLSALTGMVFSDQRIRDSALDIDGKAHEARPWDVHAERLVTCRHCHFSPNHPGYARRDSRRSPDHVSFEPRRLEVAEYLFRPDHRLARGPDQDRALEDGSSSSMRRCENCHDASAGHAWLPRPRRHFAALACETCHIPRVFGPAWQEVDWTVPSADASPRVVFRGVESSSERDTSSGSIRGFAPLLLRGKDERARIQPYNVITTRRWTERPSGAHNEGGAVGGAEISTARLMQALLSKEGTYKPEVLSLLDADRDGRLSDEERVLSSPEQVRAMADLLRGAGFVDPRIQSDVRRVPIHHSVGPARTALKACATCHSAASRFVQPFALSSEPSASSDLISFADAAGAHPFAASNVLSPSNASDASNASNALAGSAGPAGSKGLGGHPDEGTMLAWGSVESTPDAALSFKPSDERLHLHVFGLSRSKPVDVLGLGLVLLTALGALVHGAVRYFTATRTRAKLERKAPLTERSALGPQPKNDRPQPAVGAEPRAEVDVEASSSSSREVPAHRVQVYSLFERLWHWLQALSILALFVTGAEVHYPETVSLLGFANAVRAHEWLAMLLFANAFLSLFYHLSTGAVQKFIPASRDFFSLAFTQAKYYLYGIFTGASHPLQKSETHRLNVLQQVTYVLLLNIALPLQVGTGVVLWKAEDWPGLVETLGGLRFVSGVHVAMAWMMIAFVVMHVYLTTTGRTPLSHLKSMVLGWEETEQDAEGREERL